MGAFHCVCAESGLLVTDEQRLIVLRELAADSWVPIAVPIASSPDGYGRMEDPKRLDPNLKSILAFGKTLDYEGPVPANLDVRKLGLGTMIDNIQGDGGGPGGLTTCATREGHRISYALIYGPIYDAIVHAVAKSTATAWMRFAQVCVQTPEPPLPHRIKTKAKRARVDPTLKRLADAVVASPETAGVRQVLVDHLLEQDDPYGKLLAVLPAVGRLSFDALAAIAFPAGTTLYGDIDQKLLVPALREFVRFRAWGTRWSPTNDESRFTGYRLRYEGDPDAAEPYVERARSKYRGMPALLKVCDASERRFREMEVDTEHDLEDS